jgi:hypothetical protein
VIVIHDAAVVAVHAQLLPELTAIAPLPPLAAIACVMGSSVYVHGVGVGAGAGGAGMGGAGFGGGRGVGVGSSASAG